MALLIIECTNLVRTTINNHNSVVYVDMMGDMKDIKNGIFQAAIRISDGYITDYTLTKPSVMRINANTSPTAIHPGLK